MIESITISSSLRFKEEIRALLTVASDSGIKAEFPNLDSGLTKEQITEETMRRLEQDHFGSIDISDAVYVLCPGGYTGSLVAAEIGYAKAKGRPVFSSEPIADMGLRVLCSAVVSIDKIGELKEFNLRPKAG